jgi:hypothetical protein
VRRQSAQITALEARLDELAAPLIVRVMRGLLRLFLGRSRGGSSGDGDSAAEKGAGEPASAPGATVAAGGDRLDSLMQPLMSPERAAQWHDAAE